MTERRTIGKRTREYETAELGRSLPRLLDSRRADGGVMRLLTDPGGRVEEDIFRSEAAGQGVSVDPAVAAERMKLLIQGPAELDQDFLARATIAPFRSAFWSAVEHLASRPFEQPVQIGAEAPEQLGPGGEWEQSIDGYGNCLMAFLASNVRSSVGYGYGSILTERKGDRGVWRWVEAESVLHVEDGNKKLAGPSAVEILAVVDGEKVVMRLVSAEYSGSRWAEAHIHPKDGNGFRQEPVDRRPLDPHVEIPLDPIPAQILTPTWFALPLLLPCAKLDHLHLNISSQTAYAVSQALTFLRFAKGLKESDITDWAAVGPKVWYATTAEDADMKWVTLGADAIQAGIQYEDHILRAVEVAGLAPMLTRMPGDEKATGIAVATGRARSGAEAIKNMIQSGATNAYTRLAAYTPSAPDVQLKLYGGFSASPDQMAAARIKADIYLDPKGGMERPEFWLAMAEHGIVDSARVEELAEWAERANPEQARLGVERSKVLLDVCREGMLIGTMDGRKSVFWTLAENRIFHPTVVEAMGGPQKMAETLAESDEGAGMLTGGGLEALDAALRQEEF